MGDVEVSYECFSEDWAQTGVGGNKWYRFAGAGGDALPLTSPGDDHCGTTVPGWLSDWDGTQPCTKDDECTGECGRHDVCVPTPEHPAPPGHYPEATEGVVEKTACYDYGKDSEGGAWTCDEPNQVGVVMCDGFPALAAAVRAGLPIRVLHGGERAVRFYCGNLTFVPPTT